MSSTDATASARHLPMPETPAPRVRRLPGGGLWIHHDDVRLWRTLGARALEDADGKLALNCWRRVRELEPQSDEALLHLGRSLLLVGEAGRACLVFDALADKRNAPAAVREEARRLVAMHEPVED